MKQKKRVRIALEYLAGVAVLVLALAISWFFPEWYGQLQDRRLMGEVALSSRGDLEYLDTTSLSMAGKMRKISEASSFEWFPLEGAMKAQIPQCRSAIELWCENGLLPAWCAELVTYDNFLFLENAMVLLYYDDSPQQGALSISIHCYSDPSNQNSLTLIMDQDLNMLYYASLSGERALDYWADRWGFADSPSLSRAASADPDMTILEDFTETRFDLVCGADSYLVDGSRANLLTENARYLISVNVTLDFGDFRTRAYRRGLLDSFGTGFAIYYGTHLWLNLLTNTAERQDAEGILSPEAFWMGETEAYASMDASFDKSAAFP